MIPVNDTERKYYQDEIANYSRRLRVCQENNIVLEERLKGLALRIKFTVAFIVFVSIIAVIR